MRHLIMSYSTKLRHHYTVLFIDAEKSAPSDGDRKGYQAEPGDLRTALRGLVLLKMKEQIYNGKANVSMS